MKIEGEPTSAWSKYKNKLGKTRPWDAINPENYTDENTAHKRINVCEVCPRYIKQIGQCRECRCFMRIKTRLKDAKCPIGKW